MTEFNCFISGTADDIVKANTEEEAKAKYLEMVLAKLTVNDIIAVEMDDA